MSVSSLLKSAKSTQAKIQAAQDAEVNFEWQSSAQTYDDYIAYKNYLDQAAAKTSDPSEQISYATKQRSAFSSYTGNEIQRQTQSVIEGRGTIDDKMATVSSLYDQAVASGNFNLAQNLVSTWDSLSVQKQNQLQAATATARANASASTTDFKNTVHDMVDQYEGVLGSVVKAYTAASTPAEQKANIDQLNKFLPQDQQLDPNTGIFDIIASISQAIGGNGPNSILQQAIDLAPDAATKKAFETEFNKYQTKSIVDLPGTDGKAISLTMDDVKKQIAAAQIGESTLTPIVTAQGTAWAKNKIDNYQFSRQADGSYAAVPTYSVGGRNIGDTVVDENGKPIKVNGQQAHYTDLLKAAGFDVTTSNGALIVTDPSAQGRLNGNNSAQVYLDKDGHLQMVNNENQIYQLNFDKTGAFTGTAEITPNPLNDIVGADARFNNPYFANLSEGERSAIQKAVDFGAISILDQSLAKNQEIKGGINLGNQGISGLPLPKFSSGATGMVQGGNPLSVQALSVPIQAPQIAQAPMPQIQAPQLSPNTISSKANIVVAKPTAPTANISTKPLPSGSFGGVSNKPNTGKISF